MAVKKSGVKVSLTGKELRKFLEAVEAEERSSITLGETVGPLFDLYETSDDIVVEADIPGIDPDDVEINILGGLLTIEGVKRERMAVGEKVNYLCMERSFEPFRRIIKITVPINPLKGRAVYSKGVLTVSFPKLMERRGEPIKIKVEKD